MCLDQNSAIVLASFIASSVGIIGYAVQNYYMQKREFKKRDYERKEDCYAKFMRISATAQSPRIFREGKIPDDLKEELNQQVYLVQLYAPSEVVAAMNGWIDELRPEVRPEKLRKAWQHLAWMMRKDLTKETVPKETDMQIFRAE